MRVGGPQFHNSVTIVCVCNSMHAWFSLALGVFSVLPQKQKFDNVMLVIGSPFVFQASYWTPVETFEKINSQVQTAENVY